MNFKYRFALPVSVDEAWPILLDLRRVAPCMPGAAIEAGDGDAYVGRMKVKIGPIEMAYRGDLRFLERDDAAHRLKVEGVGKELRGGGGARAVVTMDAVPTAGGCEISIDSDYSLSGRAAQFGSGMIDEIGGKLMKEFARRLEKLLLARGEEAVPSPAAPPPMPVASARPVVQDVFSGEADDNEALDLVGLAWGPVVSRAIPVVHLLISAATLIYVMIKL